MNYELRGTVDSMPEQQDKERNMSDLELLQKVMDAAEALSSAMIESEPKGADYSLIDEQWSHLTATIQAVYRARKK